MESEKELFAEFEKKYMHIKDFYKLKSIHQSSDLTIVHLQFICVQCLPKNKLLKYTSQAPFSNLKAHLANVHSSSAAKFDTIRQIYIKYNTILSSSASPERLFSKGKLTFQTKRHRLLNENFEKQLLLNCNSHFYRAFNK